MLKRVRRETSRGIGGLERDRETGRRKGRREWKEEGYEEKDRRRRRRKRGGGEEEERERSSIVMRLIHPKVSTIKLKVLAKIYRWNTK